MVWHSRSVSSLMTRVLARFNLDMNTLNFVMCPFFDKTVNPKSIDPTKLCIQNNKSIHNRVTVSAVLPALWILTHGFKIYLTVTS